jgi:oligopeptide/dipeptide ABC transporter ATP-binding protein
MRPPVAGKMAESDPSHTSTILELRNLSVTYRSSSGTVQAVRGASLEIREGETLSIVGETGSGKSTIALAALGLLDRQEQSGDILYKNRPIQSLSAREWERIRSREIGIVFQDSRSALNPVRTVLNHVVETLRAHQDISRKDARHRALEILRDVGIRDGQEQLHPFVLSGGMCQRVGIALGICNKPHLLIADEPTSAVDSAIQAQMLDLLQDLKQRYGLALLLISHDLPLISQISDRMSVMYHGRIVECGSRKELLDSPAHPYTRSLLQCQPSFENHHEGNPVTAIPGAVPAAGQVFQGCSFAPRCGRAEPRCRETEPEERALSRTHRVACIHEHSWANGSPDPSDGS